MLIRGPIFLLLPIACLHLRACFPPSRKTPIVMIRMSAKMDLTKAQHCSMICYGMLLFDRAQWEVWCFLGICLKITKPIHLSLTKFKNDIHLEVFHHHFNKPAKLRRCRLTSKSLVPVNSSTGAILCKIYEIISQTGGLEGNQISYLLFRNIFFFFKTWCESCEKQYSVKVW